jgi:hypothetical protein
MNVSVCTNSFFGDPCFNLDLEKGICNFRNPPQQIARMRVCPYGREKTEQMTITGGKQ